jgi:transcriptional regulator with XRE-family HTH domain
MASTKKAADHPFEKATTLPRMLREWRHMNHIKLSAAADDLEVSMSTWGHWETGARFPKGKKLLELVEYTGIPLHQLICSKTGDFTECHPQPDASGNGDKLVTKNPKTLLNKGENQIYAG